jgi:hypothetical protein
MAWYIVFRGRKVGVYDSWGVHSEYILLRMKTQDKLYFEGKGRPCEVHIPYMFI